MVVKFVGNSPVNANLSNRVNLSRLGIVLDNSVYGIAFENARSRNLSRKFRRNHVRRRRVFVSYGSVAVRRLTVLCIPGKGKHSGRNSEIRLRRAFNPEIGVGFNVNVSVVAARVTGSGKRRIRRAAHFGITDFVLAFVYGNVARSRAYFNGKGIAVAVVFPYVPVSNLAVKPPLVAESPLNVNHNRVYVPNQLKGGAFIVEPAVIFSKSKRNRILSRRTSANPNSVVVAPVVVADSSGIFPFFNARNGDSGVLRVILAVVRRVYSIRIGGVALAVRNNPGGAHNAHSYFRFAVLYCNGHTHIGYEIVGRDVVFKVVIIVPAAGKRTRSLHSNGKGRPLDFARKINYVIVCKINIIAVFAYLVVGYGYAAFYVELVAVDIRAAAKLNRGIVRNANRAAEIKRTAVQIERAAVFARLVFSERAARNRSRTRDIHTRAVSRSVVGKGNVLGAEHAVKLALGSRRFNVNRAVRNRGVFGKRSVLKHNFRARGNIQTAAVFTCFVACKAVRAVYFEVAARNKRARAVSRLVFRKGCARKRNRAVRNVQTAAACNSLVFAEVSFRDRKRTAGNVRARAVSRLIFGNFTARCRRNGTVCKVNTAAVARSRVKRNRAVRAKRNFAVHHVHARAVRNGRVHSYKSIRAYRNGAAAHINAAAVARRLVVVNVCAVKRKRTVVNHETAAVARAVAARNRTAVKRKHALNDEYRAVSRRSTQRTRNGVCARVNNYFRTQRNIQRAVKVRRALVARGFGEERARFAAPLSREIVLNFVARLQTLLHGSQPSVVVQLNFTARACAA